jgi:serine/threonine protein kinase
MIHINVPSYHVYLDNFLSTFPLNEKEKEKYSWQLRYISNNNNNYGCSLLQYALGIKKDSKEEFIFVKKYFIKFEESEEKKLKNILKEIYFLYLLKTKEYIVQISDILFSGDKQYVYLVFKSDSASLAQAFPFIINRPEIIKKIIYQITFGLYFLHENNIIHYDIKPSNILINGPAKISICDFGSAFKKGENPSSFTLCYASPEFLIYDKLNDKLNINEKCDIWGLGVITLELLCNELQIFKNDSINENYSKEEAQLLHLLNLFGTGINSIDDLKNRLNENEKINFEINQSYLDKIHDPAAIDFLKKIFVFYPNERISAKEALATNYLKGYNNGFSFNFDKIDFGPEYYEITQQSINHAKFIDLVEKIKKSIIY